MDPDLAKALSNPFESAVPDCPQISSESDCISGCRTCHPKTIAPEAAPGSDCEASEAQIAPPTKEKG